MCLTRRPTKRTLAAVAAARRRRFPQVRKVSLVELGTHVEVAMAVGGYHDSEQKLVEQLWDYLPPDALLLEDRGFFSSHIGKNWTRGAPNS